MRELPRKLDLEQLCELFEMDTALTRRLAQTDDPLANAQAVIDRLPEKDKIAALEAHPAIGQRTGLSARSAAEQGSDADPTVLAELDRLNREYEARFGFRFVVFVNRRPKSEILDVMRRRIGHTREAELDTALAELVAIARDRWERS